MPTITIPHKVCKRLYAGYDESLPDEIAIKEIRKQAKELIHLAIDEELPMTELRPNQIESGLSQNFSFTGARVRIIRSIARANKLRESDVVLGFLLSGLSRLDEKKVLTSAKETFFDAYINARKLSFRPHQSAFANYVLQALKANGSIGFVEGATGVGKTLAVIASANEKLKDKSFGRVVVAVPTIQLIEQYCNEHERLKATGIKCVDARPIVGRSSFISEMELKDLLLNDETDVDKNIKQNILNWLSNGAPAIESSVKLSYLGSNLLKIAPEFPIDAVRLHSDTPSDDAGALAYYQQFVNENSDEPEIIYCTHAMVAADIRIKKIALSKTIENKELSFDFQQAMMHSQNKQEIRQAFEDRNHKQAELAKMMGFGKLPTWQHIIVDEAHLFETNVSNAMSSTLSLNSMIRLIKKLCEKGIITKKNTVKAQKALRKLKNLTTEDQITLSKDNPESAQAITSLQSLVEAAKTKGNKDNCSLSLQRDISQLKTQVEIINLALQTDFNNITSLLSYSPVRAFPQIKVGKQSVANDLAFLWQSAISGACISATLYLQRYSEFSAHYIANILNVPSTKRLEFPIVRPSWTYKPVTDLFIPQNIQLTDNYSGSHLWLMPPTRRRLKKDEDVKILDPIWLSELKGALDYIWNTAAGGTLVLMTSYKSTEILLEMFESKENIVYASPDISLASQKEQFLRLTKEGKKPLWLAVGGAWTGLDVSGADIGIKDPKDDDVITDLVIPRIPFATNKSITHKTRSERTGNFIWEIQDVSMKFRQGIGRLVRHEGLKQNRRIFMLDARINDDRYKHWLASIERTISNYPNSLLEYEKVNNMEAFSNE